MPPYKLLLKFPRSSKVFGSVIKERGLVLRNAQPHSDA